MYSRRVKRRGNLGELDYKILNLSEFEVVKLLVQYRYKYDKGHGLTHTDNYDLAGDVKSLNVDMIALFAYLDKLIKNCNFSEEQLTIIKMLQEGYSYQEIVKHLDKESVNAMRNRFNKICRDIIKENERQWRTYIYLGVLGLKSKECSKCKKKLPATDEFFSPNSYGKDGYYSICSKCR